MTTLSNRRFWILAILWGGVRPLQLRERTRCPRCSCCAEGGLRRRVPGGSAAPSQRAVGSGRLNNGPRAARRRRPQSAAAITPRRRPPCTSSGAESAAIDLIKRSGCRTVTDQKLRDIRLYRPGRTDLAGAGLALRGTGSRPSAAPGEARARTRQRRACSRNWMRRALVRAGGALDKIPEHLQASRSGMPPDIAKHRLF